MRVASRGNLTVELIRQQRFDVAAFEHIGANHCARLDNDRHESCDAIRRAADRVELSEAALACDPWAGKIGRAEAPLPLSDQPVAHVQQDKEPQAITPVVGSPALAGLGAALIVPGTLLDVVA